MGEVEEVALDVDVVAGEANQRHGVIELGRVTVPAGKLYGLGGGMHDDFVDVVGARAVDGLADEVVLVDDKTEGVAAALARYRPEAVGTAPDDRELSVGGCGVGKRVQQGRP